MLSPLSVNCLDRVRIGTNDAHHTRDGLIVPSTSPGVGPYLSFTGIPAPAHIEAVQRSRSGATVIVDMHVPSGRPGVVLRCRINASFQDLARLRQHAHRAINHQRSAQVIGAMVLLLAVCSSIVGGADGARRAVTGARPRAHGVSRTVVHQWPGVRLLRAEEAPGLFNALVDICRQAHLSRLPDLYYLPDPNHMNACALSGPVGSTIVLTEGLMRGMTIGEIAGILAHEVAHIRNNDTWAMSWAAALHHAIELASQAGLALLRAQNGGAGGPLEVLLSAAPTIGRFLYLALSRVRELDADAAALELTGDALSLVAALDKLERHHTGLPLAASGDPMSFLRSHPTTSERVGTVLSLAC